MESIGLYANFFKKISSKSENKLISSLSECKINCLFYITSYQKIKKLKPVLKSCEARKWYKEINIILTRS